MTRTFLHKVPGIVSPYSVWRAFSMLLVLFGALFLLVSCAKMGSPDGGWYDETPPKVIGATPMDKGTNVNSRRIIIRFNEYITIDNPTQNVVVSPPQMEMPEIRGQGKRISVHLLDSLKPNTTYTVDFSNAIKDNNEGNPLGNYTYSFSTGDHIDTMEVSGYVLQADNLEPIQGMLVGLYSNLSDTIFKKKPMLRVSRTDSRGHFVIKGIAPGKYRVYGLQDADGDYVFGQKSEMIAFNHDIIEPSLKPDTRQDTTWIDSLHIKNIERVNYTHYLPDDICLRAFNEKNTNRYLLKSERKEPTHFTLYYSSGSDTLPQLRGLNFNVDNAFVIDATPANDTINYWLRDTALVNADTLSVEIKHHITDTLGVLRLRTDTITLLSKQPYAKRIKERQKAFDTWQKAQEKKKKKGEPYDTVMPKEQLKLTISPSGEMDPDQNVNILSDVPLLEVDTAMLHLYSKPEGDTLWYREPYEMSRRTPLNYVVKASWRPGSEYSFEADSTAFKNIYGLASNRLKQGFKVRANDSYATLLVTLNGMTEKHVIGQLIDGSDKVVKQAFTSNGQLEFYYLREGKYYMRLIVDANNNGIWDTGSYDDNIQPEEVYYYPEEIECKAKWDVTRTWNPTSIELYRQKPNAITKQKGEKERTIKHRNLERAKKLGKEYIPKL
ncbi:Ig-like domain-containing protein [Hallella colorans]|uniref:Ig-like domain-containing protein n=2 Tax=Hallella colorans TaxID=1703337 RepID=A0A2U0UJQ8_9BACT|nr:Ig-like domain-containing protein [Hallella colorans]